MKQLTYGLLISSMWLTLTGIWQLTGELNGFTIWVMIIFPIIWYLSLCYGIDLRDEMVDRIFRLLDEIKGENTK